MHHACTVHGMLINDAITAASEQTSIEVPVNRELAKVRENDLEVRELGASAVRVQARRRPSHNFELVPSCLIPRVGLFRGEDRNTIRVIKKKGLIQATGMKIGNDR